MYNAYFFLAFCLPAIGMATIPSPTKETSQLFAGITQTNLVEVIEALNNGADLNAREATTGNTPLMAALERLHEQILDLHTTKEVLLLISGIAGAFEANYLLSKFSLPRAQEPKKPLEYLNTISIEAATFAGCAYLTNCALRYLLCRPAYFSIKEAYLIAQVILKQNATDYTIANTITGMNAHQMIIRFRTNLPPLYPGSHPFAAWHIASADASFTKKAIALAACLGFDYALQKAHRALLAATLDNFLEPLDTELQERIYGKPDELSVPEETPDDSFANQPSPAL